ncbi:MAG: DUF3737 family protein [Clostridia bacterium]|nr:DUF3737 family protein [Clostridia bacterium]
MSKDSQKDKYTRYDGLRFGEERALYGARLVELYDCRFEGEEDGESALKESQKVRATGCRFALRYPLWHADGVKLSSSEFTPDCRAAIWYAKDVRASGCRFLGIKALRECSKVTLESCDAASPEFGWKLRHVKLSATDIESEYAFFECRDVEATELNLRGKYSFQYVKDSEFRGCTFKTKDAFWHSKNVTVHGSVIDGEYLGWYSENLTLIDCHIKGTQPLCYCKGLRLINCTTEECDLAFEYSDVDAGISGEILSVKNVRSGIVAADRIGETIITADSKVESRAKIIERGKDFQS